MSSKKVKVIVLRTAGTNCDQETAFAFQDKGASVERVHINELVSGKKLLKDYHILAVPGGFTYGDDIESGRILANEINAFLRTELKKFINDGKLVLGICNGFQTLVKAGILPGALNGKSASKSPEEQSVTLYNNDSGKFEDRWVHLKVEGQGPWLNGVKNVVFFPVAHAEGKFMAKDKSVLEALKKNNQVAFKYVSPDGTKAHYPDNPNGSDEDIAGITDKTGRILGLMPHPERHFQFVSHPSWTRMPKKEKFGDGAKIFENGVNYVRKNF